VHKNEIRDGTVLFIYLDLQATQSAACAGNVETDLHFTNNNFQSGAKSWIKVHKPLKIDFGFISNEASFRRHLCVSELAGID
jgi:hypothetical protein